jgi:hypothetical protein
MARRTIKTPEQIEADRLAKLAKDFDAVNLPADGVSLPNQGDIEVTRAGQKREGQKVKEDSARRLDAFAALRDSMRNDPFVGCYDAARKFERDLLVRRREGDRQPIAERVDGGNGNPDLWFLAVVDAGRDVDFIKARLSRRDFWLLVELITPTKERPTWRAGVAYVTGEENPNAQGAAVRAACMNLRDAYAELDVAKKERLRAA